MINISSKSGSRFHALDANYDRPLFELTKQAQNSIREKLTALYGDTRGNKIFPEFKRILSVYHAYKTEEMLQWETGFRVEDRFTEKDAVLITYGDLIKDKNRKPLETLTTICKKYLRNVFNTIHILPFFPYSSDRGFSVVDFRQVDPNLGRWDDLNKMKDHFKLMFDGVFNHISSRSYWFQEFLNGNPEYADFFSSFSERKNISQKKINMLLRPRTSDVFTLYNTYNGRKFIWTTFSPDQVDLKFQNPRILLKITELLLYYVRRGADLLRLDAVTYLWDELGTSGAHLWQTHAIIKLFREILDAVAPHVALITETNVPHLDNISYFGNGEDEAQMVYNFALPPLVLHTMQTGNTSRLNGWAKTLKIPTRTATFFNFLDSHDGIGLSGAKGILTDEEIQNIVSRVREHGGFISYKKEEDGSETPYELNITSYSAMNKEDSDESLEIQVMRYLAARSISLVIIGVPGVYLHGLLGSSNDIDSVVNGNEKRSINRNILNKTELVRALEDENTSTHMISSNLARLINKRINEKAFHPMGEQRILDISDHIFAVLRISIDNSERIIALTNVTNTKQTVIISSDKVENRTNSWYDLISKQKFEFEESKLSIILKPFQICWLKEVYV